ncbi:MAG: MaoC/PaaZ C-terminal domain-containing protein [Acidimicrobiia bacterium]
MAEDKLFFDDVSEGDTAPELSHTLERTDLVKYAGASGDFNPMHTVEPDAQAAGFPSVFGHGMFSAGLVARSLTDYVGVGNLRSFKVRFTKQTWPGEVLTARNTVTAKRTEGGENLIDITSELANADGEVKVSGEAVATLPTR